jgi:hypothetical protein
VPGLPEPLRLDPAFTDPAAVLACAREGAPYRLLSVVDRGYAGDHYPPWFRGYWVVPGKTFLPGAEALLHEPRLAEAAARCFGAEVIRPQTVMINLSGPMPDSVAHVDLPYFRGAPARSHSPELLFAMSRSGLFERWAIRVASAVVWFHTGEGGAFEYWPEGHAAPSRLEPPPLWNVGLMSDNDRMLHRARAVGPAVEQLPETLLERRAELHASREGEWEIRHGDEVVCRYASGRVRISVLWKAHALANDEEAACLDAGSDDLDPESIVRILSDDARSRGVVLPQTDDPRWDSDWIHAVTALHPWAAIAAQ